MDDPLVGIGIVFIVLVLVFFVLMNIFGPANQAVVQVCKLHKWTIHPETNKLTCISCNKVAGIVEEEYEEN